MEYFFTPGDDGIERNIPITLDLGDIAISPSAPVSVKMTITTPTLGGDPHDASYRSAIVVAKALSVKASPKTPISAVAHGFKRFKAEAATVGDLGAITIKAMPYQKALDGADVASISDLIAPGVAASGNDGASGSLLGIEGSLSFATGLSLEPAGACPDAPTTGNLVMRNEDMEIQPIEVPLVMNDIGSLTYDRELCIYVREPDDMDAVAIPATSPYMAVLDFAARDDDQLSPPADRTLDLGRIMRDGTTVHIPYLTTYEDYNQRITLSNRSATPAGYEFSFRPEMGVTYRPGVNATGMLAAGETRVLRAMDLVTLIGGNRTAATVTVVAQPTDIDISSTLVDLNTGVATVTVHLSDDGIRF